MRHTLVLDPVQRIPQSLRGFVGSGECFVSGFRISSKNRIQLFAPYI